MVRQAVLILALAGAALAQNGTPPAPPQKQEAPATERPDATQQMQLDLDQMDSLVNNMATQVSFIQNTNMSILLNSNVRLWTILLRDLRLQLEQQKRAAGRQSPHP
jgi:hypothetical protein